MTPLIEHHPNPPHLEMGVLSSLTSLGAGMFLWLDQNATAIGALVAIGTLFSTITFLLLNYLNCRKKSKIAVLQEAKRRLLREAREDEKYILIQLFKRVCIED